jgi:hypothetical protein
MGCRSQAATAVCVPGDVRSMIVTRRSDRSTLIDDAQLVDIRYSRLGNNKHGRLSTTVNCRRTAVTLPMVTKKEKTAVPAKPTKPKSKPKPKISTTLNSSATASMAATEVDLSNDLVFQVIKLCIYDFINMRWLIKWLSVYGDSVVLYCYV